MTESTIFVMNTDAMLALGQRLAPLLQHGQIIGLSGELASGKTTLVRGMLRGLGWPDGMDVPSPSFSLIQYYDAPPLRLPCWHVDLYRLSSRAEIMALGLEENYRYGITLIEWPERMEDILPAHAARIHISTTKEGGRSVRLTPEWQKIITNDS